MNKYSIRMEFLNKRFFKISGFLIIYFRIFNFATTKNRTKIKFRSGQDAF